MSKVDPASYNKELSRKTPIKMSWLLEGWGTFWVKKVGQTDWQGWAPTLENWPLEVFVKGG